MFARHSHEARGEPQRMWFVGAALFLFFWPIPFVRGVILPFPSCLYDPDVAQWSALQDPPLAENTCSETYEAELLVPVFLPEDATSSAVFSAYEFLGDVYNTLEAVKGPDSFRGPRVKFERVATARDATTAFKTYMQYTLGNRTRLSSIGAMVGGYSSGRAEALNLISTLRNIPHLDPAALSPRLSDVKVSPRFLRVIPSGTLHGRMIAQLLSQWDIRQVGLIFSGTPYGESVAQAIIQESKKIHPTLRFPVYRSAGRDERPSFWKDLIDTLKERRVRYLVPILDINDVYKLVGYAAVGGLGEGRDAGGLGLSEGRGLVWITPIGLAAFLTTQVFANAASGAPLLAPAPAWDIPAPVDLSHLWTMLNGAFETIHIDPAVSDELASIVNAAGPSYVFASLPRSLLPFLGGSLDAAAVAVCGMHRLVVSGRACQLAGPDRNGTALYEAMRTLTMSGANGPSQQIAFDSFGDMKASMFLKNYRHAVDRSGPVARLVGEEVPVGTWTVESSSVKLTRNISWSDGSFSTRPLDDGFVPPGEDLGDDIIVIAAGVPVAVTGVISAIVVLVCVVGSKRQRTARRLRHPIPDIAHEEIALLSPIAASPDNLVTAWVGRYRQTLVTVVQYAAKGASERRHLRRARNGSGVSARTGMSWASSAITAFLTFGRARSRKQGNQHPDLGDIDEILRDNIVASETPESTAEGERREVLRPPVALAERAPRVRIGQSCPGDSVSELDRTQSEQLDFSNATSATGTPMRLQSPGDSGACSLASATSAEFHVSQRLRQTWRRMTGTGSGSRTEVSIAAPRRAEFCASYAGYEYEAIALPSGATVAETWTRVRSMPLAGISDPTPTAERNPPPFLSRASQRPSRIGVTGAGLSKPPTGLAAQVKRAGKTDKAKVEARDSTPKTGRKDLSAPRAANSLARAKLFTHSSTVMLLGASKAPNATMIVKEGINGSVLASALAEGMFVTQDGAFDHVSAISVLTDVVDAMEFVRTLGPLGCFGRLNPHSIWLDSKKFVAKFAGDTFDWVVPAGQCVSYIAPEILAGGAPLVESDVFSFGALLYEIYAGRPLISAAADAAQWLRDLASGCLSLPPAPLGMPDALALIMEECLVCNPMRRPEWGEIRQRLDAAMSAAQASWSDRVAASAAAEPTAEAAKSAALCLPPHVRARLEAGEALAPDSYEVTHIYLSDVVNFTELSSRLSSVEVLDMITRLHSQFDEAVEKHNLFKVGTIGDAYMVVGGIATGRDGSVDAETALQGAARRVAQFALETVEASRNTPIKLGTPGDHVRIRVGLHTGPLVGSLIGTINPRYKVLGQSVRLASVMESTSAPMCIQMTRATRDALVREWPQAKQLRLIRRRGTVQLKGWSEAVHTYWLGDTPDVSSLGAEEVVRQLRRSRGPGPAAPGTSTGTRALQSVPEQGPDAPETSVRATYGHNA